MAVWSLRDLGAYQRLFSLVFNNYLRMAITYDFTIVPTNLNGISQVMPQNEDAFRYLVDETHYSVFQDGSTVLFDEFVGDFVSDAGHAHMCCELVWGFT